MGATAVDTDDWHRPFRNDHRASPAKLHRYDANRVQCVTAHLRRLDDRFGGAVSRDVVAAHLRTCQALLMSIMDDETRMGLHVGLAQLHGLAGWTAIDLGQTVPALRHLARATEHARLAGEPSLIAVTLCDAARLYLHQGDGMRALRLLQLAQMVAVESAHPVAAALCVANLAWAYALFGDAGQATVALDRARNGLVEGVGRSGIVPWLAWFGEADLRALTGTVYAVLPGGDRDHQAIAVEALRASIALRGNESKRARSLQTAVLSRTLFDAGDIDDAVKTGGEAMDLADLVGSARVGDLLRSLRAATGYHHGWPGVSDLTGRITAHLKARRHLYA
jgi:hypothetical protein